MENKTTIIGKLVIIFLFTSIVSCNRSNNVSSSYKSKAIQNTLKAINFSEKTFNKLLDTSRVKKQYITIKTINRKLHVTETVFEKFKMFTVFKKNTKPKKHIVFFHGGAYFAEAGKGHLYLIEQFALKYSYTVSFIEYPLAPTNNATKNHHIVQQFLRILSLKYPNDSFYFFGDSAGGGLALSCIQNNSAIKPLKTALVSPWIDISMSNPEIDSQAKSDVILSKDGLIKCGTIYRDTLKNTNPLVSPIYGDLRNLNEVKIWVSNLELFYPDCMLIHKKIKKSKGSFSEISVHENMMHDWIIFPIEEREQTILEIVNFFKGTK